MDIKYLLKILKLNLHWLIIVPIVAAALVFFIVRTVPDNYSSNSLVYTGIATGYNINVESTDQNRVDYLTVKVTFDNIINIINSREAKTEVGIRLLINDMLSDKVDMSSIEEYRTNDIDELIEKLNYSTDQYDIELAIKSLTRSDYQDFDNESVAKIYKMLNAGDSLLTYLILNSEHSPYSIKNISNSLAVNRKGDSDMIELAYVSNDPAKAQETLVTILDVFTRKQSQIKETEALSVVKYFETELNQVDFKLKSAENELKQFNEENNVINFQSQTDLIAKQKEVIQTEYNEELMSYRGAQKSRSRLELELKKKNNLPKFNAELIDKQKELSNLNAKKARLELQHKTSEISIVQDKIYEVETSIESTVAMQFSNSSNTNNVSVDNLLTEWLQKIIDESESEARLKVYQQRLVQIQNEYETYAPLGAKLSQLQRKVDIHEEEYLQTMNNLNQSKVRQNNVVMSSAIDIIDYPSKPTEPLPSKKMTMLILGGMLGFIIVFTLVFIKVYFDNSVRTPQRAQQLLDIPSLGVLPYISKKQKHKKYVEQLTNQIISKFRLLGHSREKIDIMVFSVHQNEGKSTFIEEITSRLDDEDLIKFRFHEHPALIEGNIHHDAISSKSDIQIIVIDGNRELEEADFYHIARLTEITSNKYIVLNKVKKHILDSILGKIPRK